MHQRKLGFGGVLPQRPGRAPGQADCGNLADYFDIISKIAALCLAWGGPGLAIAAKPPKILVLDAKIKIIGKIAAICLA